MATGIESLFNIPTSQALQQAYIKQQQVSPDVLAQLDLTKQGVAMARDAGSSIGMGLGRLFGGSLPGEMQADQMRQAMSGISGNTQSERMLSLAQQLQNIPGMEGQAALAAQKAAEFKAEEAKAELAAQKDAAQMRLWAAQEKKALQLPSGSDLSKLIAERDALVAKDPNDPRIKFYDDKLAGDTNKVNYGVDRESLAKSKFNKPFSKLTQKEAAVVEDTYQEDLTKRARASVPSAPKNVADQFKGYDEAVKDDKKIFNTTKTAFTLIKEAEQANNPEAWEGARTLISKGIGEDKLSNEDIRRMGVDPNLVRAGLDWINKRITGSVPTQNTINQLKQVIVLINNAASKRINDQSERFATALSFDYKAPQDKLNLWFPKTTALPSVTINGAQTSKPGKAVSWNSLPE